MNEKPIIMSSPTSVVPLPSETPESMEPITLPAVTKEEEVYWKSCPASEKSLRTTNPIRAIVDPIVANIKSGIDRGDGLDPISLALGDPTVTGNLPPCKDAIDAVVDAAQMNSHAAGYVNACGTPSARKAVAEFHSTIHAPISAENIIIASGCSGALELALTALLDPGTVLLVPSPGFPLYEVIAKSHGASVVKYRLLPDRHWECDLEHLSQLMAQHSNVRGILINNPSNPTGSVFSESHLKSLVNFSHQYRLPIIADEIYGDLSFGDNKFYPLAKISADMGRKVPVITASGLGKQFLLPGWRVGWIAFHDNIYGSLQDIEAGAKRLAQVILGACHLAQTVIPSLLSPTSLSIPKFKEDLCSTLRRQAYFLCERLKNCPGLKVIEPQGTFYAMVQIDCSHFDKSIENDIDFSKLLLEEENVFVLPGSAFDLNDAFRVVFCGTEIVLEEASNRIQRFCERHERNKVIHEKLD